MDLKFNIRTATPADAKRLAALGALVWMHTYLDAGIDETVADYVLKEFTKENYEKILANKEGIGFVAESADAIYGYALLQLAPPPAQMSLAEVELRTLYVQPVSQGARIGTALLDAARAHAKGWKASPLWLTVYAGNQRAIEFYLRKKFKKIGDTYFQLGEARHANLVFQSDDCEC